MGRNIYENANPAATKEIARLVEGVAGGDRLASAYLIERLGTTDGVYAFANLANVSVQEWFNGLEPIWSKFSTKTVVNDFRSVNWVDLTVDFSNFKAADKGTARHPLVIPQVAEGEKYESFSLNSQQLAWGVSKFGAQIGFTWEAFINDPYNTVGSIPKVLANTAVNVHDANATRALWQVGFADTAGSILQPTTAIVGHTTPINSALSLDAIYAARQQLILRQDPSGNFPNADATFVLNYSPALAGLVANIFSQNTVVTTTVSAPTPGAGVQAVGQRTFANVSLGDVLPVQNRYLSFYAAANTNAWVLSVAPGTGRPSILSAFLASEQEPEVRISGLAGYTPTGTQMPFTSGSFDNDTFDLRVRVVGGAGGVNYASLGIVVSTGAGV
jgi:hypothetical protein